MGTSPRSTVRRGNLLLVALAALAVVMSVGSDALLRRSQGFWSFCAGHSIGVATRPLYLEAVLELLEPGEVDVLVVGNSIAFADVAPRQLAQSMRLPDTRVATLSLAGATPLELSMLTPELERLRPRLVVFLATAWTLHQDAAVGGLRFYDPGFAWSLFTPAELLRDRTEHASHLLGAHHVVIRHRDALRRVLHRAQVQWVTGAPAETYWMDDPAAAERFARRARTRRSDFDCPSPHTRALELMSHRLDAHDAHLVVVATPVMDRHGRHETLRKRLDACLIQGSHQVGYHYFAYTSLREVGRGRFRDTMHMNRAGRREFTAELAAHLAPLLRTMDREE